VGHEFSGAGDTASALEEIVELGARNVLITEEGGCFALVRDGSEEKRVRATAPRLEAVSTIGAGDTLLAGFLAARLEGRSVEESVRHAVSVGSASVLEAGPGRFDPKRVAGVESLVTIEPLNAVAQDA
jgi:fructose-1-phosphate kinase PfkB-like protein